MAKRLTRNEKADLDFLYGKNWRKNPAIYRIVMHSSDTVRRCAYCGKPMNASDVNDFGTLCESCYRKEYNH